MDEHPNIGDVESERAYAVYDAATGSIRHFHKVTVHRGAKLDAVADDLEAQALEYARERHADVELAVIEISPTELDGAPRRVDLESRSLKAD